MPIDHRPQYDNRPDRVAESSNAPNLLEQKIPDNIIDTILNGMYGNDDEVHGLPDAHLSEQNKRDIAQRLRAIYSAAYIEHTLSTRELTTELDRLLKGIISADVESVHSLLDPPKFDHFADLFQAASVDIWLQSTRLIDYRGFREELHEPGPSSLRILQALARHLQNARASFEAISPLDFVNALSQEPSPVRREVNIAYYKYLRPRSDRFPDRTIVRMIADLYEATFKTRFILSEQKSDHRKTAERRHSWNGPSMRFACAVIRELGLYQFMGPFRTSDKTLPRNATPLDLPKNRSYDEHGDAIYSIDVTQPFPWEIAKAADGGVEPDKDAWEQMKNRIKDSWDVDRRA